MPWTDKDTPPHWSEAAPAGPLRSAVHPSLPDGWLVVQPAPAGGSLGRRRQGRLRHLSHSTSGWLTHLTR